MADKIEFEGHEIEEAVIAKEAVAKEEVAEEVVQTGIGLKNMLNMSAPTPMGMEGELLSSETRILSFVSPYTLADQEAKVTEELIERGLLVQGVLSTDPTTMAQVQEIVDRYPSYNDFVPITRGFGIPREKSKEARMYGVMLVAKIKTTDNVRHFDGFATIRLTTRVMQRLRDSIDKLLAKGEKVVVRLTRGHNAEDISTKTGKAYGFTGWKYIIEHYNKAVVSNATAVSTEVKIGINSVYEEEMLDETETIYNAVEEWFAEDEDNELIVSEVPHFVATKSINPDPFYATKWKKYDDKSVVAHNLSFIYQALTGDRIARED